MPGNRVHNPADIRAVLDAWREQGADRVDPLRFGVIAALERRAHRYDGPVRELLQDRLIAMVEAYASALDATAKPGGSVAADVDSQARTRTGSPLGSPPDADAGRRPDPGSSPLRLLLDRIGVVPQTAELPTGANGATASPTSTFLPLPALAEFEQLWSRIRTDSQLRQSLEPAPAGTGPLHSSTLLHRAMTLMHEASPGYLQHFVAYVDALTWMEQLRLRAAPDARIPTRCGNSRGSSKPRALRRGG